MMDAIDRRIINTLQGGFPICKRPYAAAAAALDIPEADLIARIERLISEGVLSRFGPMFNADRMGGGFCLAAMSVPERRFREVVDQINAHPEVAHNYERAHALNVWFVVAATAQARIEACLAEIKCETGLEVYAFPKLAEYFVGMRVEA
jgi:siroheme decarboxylase